MAHLNKQCLCCGTKYSFCPDCSGVDRFAPAWKATFCSDDCKTIWHTAIEYNFGNITKHDAKKIISSINLKQTEKYVKCIQRDLENIFKEESKPKRVKRIEPKHVDDVVVVEPIAVEPVVIAPIVAEPIEEITIVNNLCEVVEKENE